MNEKVKCLLVGIGAGILAAITFILGRKCSFSSGTDSVDKGLQQLERGLEEERQCINSDRREVAEERKIVRTAREDNRRIESEIERNKQFLSRLETQSTENKNSDCNS